MSTNQMMLTICGIVLLSAIILNLNQNFYQNTTRIQKSKFDITSVEVANSYLENIKNAKKYGFDENSLTVFVSSPTSFSNILGKDATEGRSNDSTNTYDDIDDFNNDTTSTQLASGVNNSKAIYYIRGLVQYYDPAIPGVTSSKTFHKKVTVTVVSSISPKDTIRLSTIISYWGF